MQHTNTVDTKTSISDWESGLCPLVFIEVDVDDVSEAFPLKCVIGDK